MQQFIRWPATWDKDFRPGAADRPLPDTHLLVIQKSQS